MSNRYRNLLSSAILMSIVACGGSSSSSPETPATPSPPAATILTGIFTDSPVSGLRYQTTTQSGLTTSAGEFNYIAGESVSFSLGGIQLGRTLGDATVSPFDMVNVDNFDEAAHQGVEDRLVNMLIFLQSMDADKDPSNGIDLSGLDESLSASQLEFDVDVETFTRSNYRQIVNRHGGWYQTAKAAKNHLLRSLGQTVTVNVPLTDSLDDDGDGIFDRVIHYDYMEEGRPELISEIESATGEVTATTSFEYDENGNLAVVQYSRFQNGDLVEESKKVIEFHPIFGMLHYVVDVNGETVTEIDYVYDDVGNLSSSSILQVVSQPNPLDHLEAYFHFRAFGPGPTQPGDSDSGIFNPFNPGGSPTGLPFQVLSIEIESTFEYDDGFRLRVTDRSTTTTSFGESTSTSISHFSDNRLESISFSTDGFPTTEFRHHYDHDGRLISCETRVDGVLQSVIDDPVFPFQLPGPVITQISASSTSGCATVLTGDVETDDEGRIISFSTPAFLGSTGSAIEYDYDGDSVTEIRIDNENDGTFEITYEYTYNHDGDLIEETRVHTGVLFFHRKRELTTLVLAAFP